jgi:hypothetical protein
MARTKSTRRRLQPMNLMARDQHNDNVMCNNLHRSTTSTRYQRWKPELANGGETEVKEDAKSGVPQLQDEADVEKGTNRDIDGDSNKGENDDSAGDSDKECTGTSPHALTEVTKLPHDIVLTMSEGSVKA